VRKDDKKYCSKRKKRSTEKGVRKKVKKELCIEKRALLREENEGRLESTNGANECLVRGKVNPFFSLSPRIIPLSRRFFSAKGRCEWSALPLGH